MVHHVLYPHHHKECIVDVLTEPGAQEVGVCCDSVSQLLRPCSLNMFDSNQGPRWWKERKRLMVLTIFAMPRKKNARGLALLLLMQTNIYQLKFEKDFFEFDRLV